MEDIVDSGVGIFSGSRRCFGNCKFADDAELALY